MTSEERQKLDQFFGSFAGGSTPLLLLDYDGTLAGFRINRFTARPWAGVPELLKKIQDNGRTRMAVITGRPAGEIETMLALDSPLEVWGLHGAERLYPDGRRELQPVSPAVLGALAELRVQLSRDAFGGLFEDKPNAAVMHWRGRTPGQARFIECKTRALFEPLAQLDGLSLLEFEAGLELRAGRDKGGAVKAILEESGSGNPVTFVGDDLTDEVAFRAVNEAEGPHLSVLMRRERRESAAEVWLRPPEELRFFLEKWLKAVSAG